MTPPQAPVTQADLDKMRELLELIGRHLPSLPWKVHGDAGKPVIAGHKSGNLFFGYIATWEEADLLCLTINSLPQMLDEIARHRHQSDTALREALIEARKWVHAFPVVIDHDRQRALKQIDDALEGRG